MKVERQIHVVKEEEVGGVLARRHQQLPSKRGQYDSYIDVNIDKENEEKGKENRRENKGAYEMRMCVRDGDMLDVNDAGAGKREKPSKSSSASSASAKQIDSLVEKEVTHTTVHSRAFNLLLLLFLVYVYE